MKVKNKKSSSDAYSWDEKALKTLVHLRFMRLRWGRIKRPHGNCLPSAVRKLFYWLAAPNGRRYRNLCHHRSGQNVAVSRGLGLGPPELTNQPVGPRLGHRKSHRPSHYLCEGALNKTEAGPETKNLHTHGPTGTIAGGAHNRAFF